MSLNKYLILQSPYTSPELGNIYYSQYKKQFFQSLLIKKSQRYYKMPNQNLFPQCNFNFCVSVNRRIINSKPYGICGLNWANEPEGKNFKSAMKEKILAFSHCCKLKGICSSRCGTPAILWSGRTPSKGKWRDTDKPSQYLIRTEFGVQALESPLSLEFPLWGKKNFSLE